MGEEKSQPQSDQAGHSFRGRAFFALAVPMIVSRMGLATMGIADGVMVSRYGAREFAWLALAEGTLGRLLDVAVALLIGGLVLVPRHLARDDAYGARMVWKRTLPVALALGLGCLSVGFAGQRLLTLAGEAHPLAAGAGAVMAILGLGYPAALVAISAAVFLEGIRHPVFVAVSVVSANIVNIAINWLLISGHFGLPVLGARGSAWSTTIVRCALAIVLCAFALHTGGRGVDNPSEVLLEERRLARRTQWRLGFGGAATTGAMALLTAPLLVFAGWLGVIPLAVFSAMWNMAAPVGLISLGLADATGIQVAESSGGQGDRPATSLAWAALRTSMLAVAAPLVVWIGLARPIAALYTTDTVMRAAMPPLVPLIACILLLDCAGFILSSSLRGLGEAVWPASIEIGSMLLVVPLAAALGLGGKLGGGLGVPGLLLAALLAAAVRTTLLTLRLRLRATPHIRASALSESWPLHVD